MKKLLVAAALLAACSLPVVAKTYKVTKEAPLATVAFPDSWTVTQEKEGDSEEGLHAYSEDTTVYVNIEVHSAASIGDAIDASLEFFKESKVKIDEASMKQSETKLNGVDVVMMKWDATDEDGPTKVGLIVVPVKGDKGLLFTYRGAPEDLKKHGPELDSVMQSIAKVE